MKKITGMKTVAIQTRMIPPNSGLKVQVAINLDTYRLDGTILPQNHYSVYGVGRWIGVADYYSPVTMATVKADAIRTLQEREDFEAHIEKMEREYGK